MNWFIIVIAIFAVIIIMKLLHLRHLKHRIMGILIVIIILFFMSTIYLVSRENNIDMTTASGFYSGMNIYLGWLLHSFQNVASITGYTIGMDWKSTNHTIDNTTLIKNAEKNTIAVINKTGEILKANTPKKIISYN